MLLAKGLKNIDKAIIACENSDIAVIDHFTDDNKIVKIIADTTRKLYQSLGNSETCR